MVFSNCSLQDKLQQCAKSAERGAPAQDGERQRMEHDSLRKECDCLRKVRGCPSQESHIFPFPRHAGEMGDFPRQLH